MSYRSEKSSDLRCIFFQMLIDVLRPSGQLGVDAGRHESALQFVQRLADETLAVGTALVEQPGDAR